MQKPTTSTCCLTLLILTCVPSYAFPRSSHYRHHSFFLQGNVPRRMQLHAFSEEKFWNLKENLVIGVN